MADHFIEAFGFTEPPQAFKPYCYHSPSADTLLLRFRADADESVRLSEHVTKLISLDTGDLVGVKIKGIKALTEDLPNFVKFKHGNAWTIIFFEYWRAEKNDEAKKAIETVAEAFRDVELPEELEACLACN